MKYRQVIEQIRGRPTSDGAGVKLLRVFGGPGPERFDPFLLLDEFGSEEASDYIAGFPPHPHRGFETVTYMLEGKMEHRDHMDNVGLLSDGGVQWMTAGKGIIHSEMPKQTQGKMRGFQLWVNLPASRKLSPANYQDIPPEDTPVFDLDGITVKAIAGQTEVNGNAVKGYFDIPDTEVLYLDLHLEQGKQASITLPDQLNAMAYVYEGEVNFGDKQTVAHTQTLNRFSKTGDALIVDSPSGSARLLILAGKPLNEPIAQHGPFVMNTAEEIEQAILDYQSGQLVG